MINALYEELGVQHICVDDTQSGYLATNHLIEKGHQQLLLVTKIDDLQGKYRMKGFIRAIEEAKLQFRPADIVTYTNEIASHLIKGLSEKGLSIPNDFSIIGNDDSNLRITGNITLTTLSHPKEAMGELAATYILKDIQHEAITNYYFKPVLIEGQSVRAL